MREVKKINKTYIYIFFPSNSSVTSGEKKNEVGNPDK